MCTGPKAKSWRPFHADCRVSEFSVISVQEPWQNPRIFTTHNPSNSPLCLLYPLSAAPSVCFFMNKFLNPSSCSTCLPTLKCGYLCLRCFVMSIRDVTIHNVYKTRNLSPILSENLLPDEPLLLDTLEIFFIGFFYPFQSCC